MYNNKKRVIALVIVLVLTAFFYTPSLKVIYAREIQVRVLKIHHRYLGPANEPDEETAIRVLGNSEVDLYKHLMLNKEFNYEPFYYVPKRIINMSEFQGEDVYINYKQTSFKITSPTDSDEGSKEPEKNPVPRPKPEPEPVKRPNQGESSSIKAENEDDSIVAIDPDKISGAISNPKPIIEPDATQNPNTEQKQNSEQTYIPEIIADEKPGFDSRIDIYYEDVAGRNIYATKKYIGRHRDIANLSELVEDIKTFKHIGYKPENGKMVFDKNNIQKAVIIYEKEYKTSTKLDDSEVKKDVKKEIVEVRKNPEKKAGKENFKHLVDNSNLEDILKDEDYKKLTEKKNVQEKSNKEWIKKSNIKIISGYPDGKMRPKSPVKRQELAAIMYKVFSDSRKENVDKSKFAASDVNDSNWAYEAILNVVSEGLMEIKSNRFLPKSNATRLDVARAVAYLTMNIDPKFEAEFSDISDPIVSAVVSNGYMKGYPDKTFRPNANITRAELVVVMNKILDKNIEDIKQIQNFSDVDESAWYYKQIQAAVQGK